MQLHKTIRINKILSHSMTVVFLNYNVSSKQTGKKIKELYICYLNCAVLTHDD